MPPANGLLDTMALQDMCCQCAVKVCLFSERALFFFSVQKKSEILVDRLHEVSMLSVQVNV